MSSDSESSATSPLPADAAHGLTPPTSISSQEDASPKTSHYNDWPNAQGFDISYEERQPIELQVTGNIPAYAAGVLFRTGVGPRSVHSKTSGKLLYQVNHWFDCTSHVHRFQIHASKHDSDGVRVTYNSRIVSDDLIKRIQDTGKFNTYTFAAKYDPCKSIFSKLQSVFVPPAAEVAPGDAVNAVTMSINLPGISATGQAQRSPHDPTRIATICNKTDMTRVQMFDPETLEPVGLARQTILHPSLKGIMSGAHAKTDPETGDVFNYNLDFTGQLATYRVFRSSAATGETCILATIKARGAYLHSIILSKNHVILCVWNSFFKAYGASILWNTNVLDSMVYDDTVPATWYVIDKRDPAVNGQGCMAVYESDPFFAFHPVNAFEVPSASQASNKPATDSTANKVGGAVDQESDVDIVTDIPVYPNLDLVRSLYVDKISSTNRDFAPNGPEETRKILPRLTRFHLPNIPPFNPPLSDDSHTTDRNDSTASAKKRQRKTQSTTSVPNPASLPRRKITVDFVAPSEKTLELPTMNFNHVARPYRYIYGTAMGDGTKSTFVDVLIKYDLKTHTTLTWEKWGHTPSEAIFVPNPHPIKNDQTNSNEEQEEENEDNGVLLTVVLDGHRNTSYLLVLDAKTMTEVGRADVPGPVGFGFHGVYSKLHVGRVPEIQPDGQVKLESEPGRIEIHSY